MRFLNLFLLIPIFIFAFDFNKEYKNKNFTKICKYGISHINQIKYNDDILSLVGFSCVKKDYLIYLPTIINYLKTTKKGRKNSIYFSLLFIEKKLLISYMLDNQSISYYRFPLINHPLSIVLTNLISGNFKKEGGIISINYKNLNYKVYKNDENKVFIDIYKDDILKESHWYR